jgi:membrane associated rhomboid family serine protease
VNIWLTAVEGIASLIMITIAIPLLRRRVPPNALYGLRVPATFADEWVWYEANARSGRDVFALGVLLLIMSVVIPVLEFGTVAYVAWAAALVGAIGAGILGWLRANRLLKERRRTS